MAGWVLDAVEADEVETTRAHVQECPSCRDMANRLGRAVNAIPLGVDELAPSARLRERILAAAAYSRLVPAPGRMRVELRIPEASQRRFNLRGFARIPRFAVAAVVVLALAVGVVTGNLTAHHSPGQVSSQVARFTLTGHDGLAGADASVIDLMRDGVALVDFRGLPAPAPGKVFELWLIASNGRADPVAVFVPDSNGTKIVIVNRALDGYLSMAVTTEQGPDGSKFPSQQPQMSGSLA